MYCTRCGKKLNQTDKYCNSCGGRLPEVVPTLEYKVSTIDKVTLIFSIVLAVVAIMPIIIEVMIAGTVLAVIGIGYSVIKRLKINHQIFNIMLAINIATLIAMICWIIFVKVSAPQL